MAAEGVNCHGVDQKCLILRQWGRGRMAAEGRPQGYHPARHPGGVNGAAAGWPRKVC